MAQEQHAKYRYGEVEACVPQCIFYFLPFLCIDIPDRQPYQEYSQSQEEAVLQYG